MPQKKFKFLEVISLLEGRILTEHSMVSKSPEGPWKPLISWKEFSKESLAQYKKANNVSLPDITIRRKDQRFECGKAVIIATQNKGFKALCLDISQTGMSFILRTQKSELNGEMYVKFSEDLSNKTFDAEATLISMRKIKINGSAEPYFRYSVRFSTLSSVGNKFIATLAA